MRDPLTIEVLRGRLVESRHRVHAVITAADGRVLESWGDHNRLVFPRSAVKPIQALPLIETGAADHFELSEAEIALACGSHSGAPFQIVQLEDWLSRLGIEESAFECGPQRPMGEDAADTLVRRGESPRPIHNNCSGEHAGFLATALHLGERLRGYSHPDHPVQSRVSQVLHELTGCEPMAQAVATDGCGIATIAFPIHRLATAAARLGASNRLGETRHRAVDRVRRSMAAAPEMIAGPGRFDTLAMQQLGTKAITKSGAEGVFLAGSTGLGLGLFLKVEDGAQRARDAAAANLLKIAGFIDAGQQEALAYFLARPLHNAADVANGEIRAGEQWSTVGSATFGSGLHSQ